MPAAHVLAIGDELVRGATLDTNSQRIAAWLEGHGLEVTAHALVSDDPGRMLEQIERSAADAAIVVSTGGLGPTEDDRTRDVAARWAGVGLLEHRPSRERLERWADGRGRALSPSNLRQVLLPEGAQVLGNPVGTAPGFRLEHGGTQWFALPGVPYEMERMMQHKVLPWIDRHVPGVQAVGGHTLILVGLPESVAGERIAAFMAHDREPRVGITAGGGLLKVRIVGRGASIDEAAAACEATAAALRPLVADALVAEAQGTDDPQFHDLVVRALIEQRMTLATAESCTGGLVASLLTETPGVSAAFPCGFVTYSDGAKTRELGVPAATLAAHGAVSVEVAAAMARGARERAGTDLAVAITGIAGPEGGTPEKPVGTVCFAVADSACPAGTAWRRDFGEMPRAWLRRRSAAEALAGVLRLLGGTAAQGPS